MVELPGDNEYDWGALAGSSAGLTVVDWVRPEGSLVDPDHATVGLTRIAQGFVEATETLPVVRLVWTVTSPVDAKSEMPLDEFRSYVESFAELGDRLYFNTFPEVN